MINKMDPVGQLKNQCDRPVWLIVDGHSAIYRAFHAIPQLSAPNGKPTNAVFGFIRLLLKAQSILNPDNITVVWDAGLDPDRKTALPEYKENRPKMPELLAEQIPMVKEYLDAAGIPDLEIQGFEADDLIAGLAQFASKNGYYAVILSPDKDFLQLVNKTIGICNPAKGLNEIIDSEGVKIRTGVSPERIVFWLSLIGDTVDNINGVPGIGPKNATNLVNRFESIDELYNKLETIESDALKKKLKAHEQIVRRNFDLIRLKPERFEVLLSKEVHGATLPEQLVMRNCDEERLKELFSKWGFKTFLHETKIQEKQLLLF